MATTVMVADLEPMTRRAVRATIEEAGYSFAGETGDGHSAVRLVAERDPDVIVVGLQLKRISGLEVIRRVRRDSRRTAVVVLTSLDTMHTMRLCTQAGASAFVSKQAEPMELLRAIDTVRRGRTYFPSGAYSPPEEADSRSPERQMLESLSAQERLVLSYLIKGVRLRRIAEELARSESTISTYKIRLMRKLNASSVVELAQIVQRNLPEGHPVSTRAVGTSLRDDGEKGLARALVDAIPFYITIRDLKGRALFVNKYGRDVLGERSEMPVGHSFHEQALMLGVPEKDAEEIQTDFIRAARNGGMYRREIVAAHEGGITAVLHWGGAVQEDNETRVMICGSVNIDELERTIVALRDELAAAEEAATIERNFNARLLADFGKRIAKLEKSIRARNGGALASPRNASSVTSELRSTLNHFALLARAKNGGAEPQPERCNVGKLIEELVDGLQETLSPAAVELTSELRLIKRYEVLAPRLLMIDLVCLLAQLVVQGGRPDETVRVALDARPQSRGLLDIQITISDANMNSGDRRAWSKATRAAANDIITVSRKLAARINAVLTLDQDERSFRIQVGMTVKRLTNPEHGQGG